MNGRDPSSSTDRWAEPERLAAEKLLERYAVAEPDDISVERVWRRLLRTVSSPRVPRRSVPFALLASGVFALLVVLGVMLGRRLPRRLPERALSVASSPKAEIAASSAEIGAAVGGVFFTRPTESWQAARGRQALAEADRVRSDVGGMAVLDVRGVASVLVASGTDVAIDRLGAGTYLRLSRGSVVARVSKRPPGEPFVVLTDRFAVTVVGTLFEVDQDGAGHSSVSVREGTVQVAEAGGATVRVEAGQSWRSAEPGRRGEASISDSVKTILEAGLRGAAPDDLQRELEALGRSTAPGPAANSAVGTDAKARAVTPVAPRTQLSAASGTLPPLAPVAEPVVKLEKTPRAAATREEPRLLPGFAPPPAATVAVPPPVVLAEREPLAREPSPPAPSPGAAAPRPPVDGSYASGLALERQGNLSAAAAQLAYAADKDPSHADLALYALGRLFQHRLGDPQRALQAFQRYRDRYPQGSLLQEVDLAVLEIDVQTGKHERALAESLRFLATHPASERTAEVHVLRGNLLRGAGDCRTALGEYAAVTSSAFAEAGLFGTARCQEDLGNAAAAREALRAYQARFPLGPHRDEVARDLNEGPSKEF